MNKTIAIVSGGLDSVTMAYYMKSLGHVLHLLSFNYGQRHKKELDFAILCAWDIGVALDVVDLTSVGRLLKGSGSSLIDMDVPVPTGHYAAPSMASTIVPSRNAVMLAIAFSVAAAENADGVCIGVHSGDHFIYPDCRPEFIYAFCKMEQLANESSRPFLYSPFLEKTKAEIVSLGHTLKVPFEKTWSCYEGGEVHCGVCGTCTERKEAFVLAGVKDPTTYLV